MNTRLRTFLLFLLIVPFSLIAQEEEDTDIFWTRFGAKAGVNFASLSESVGDTNNRLGLNVGAFARIPITKGFVLQPEAVLSGQGYKQRLSDQEITFIYDYLIFPIMADIDLGGGFSLQAGPQASLNITAKQKTEGAGQGNANIRNANSFDFVAAGGFQYEFPEGLIVQARYAQGFNELRENQEGKNAVLSFSIGYFFQ